MFLEGWFEVPHVYDSDFHLRVYRLYTAPGIYLLKKLKSSDTLTSLGGITLLYHSI